MADGTAVGLAAGALRQYSSGFAEGGDYLRLHFNESPYGPPPGATAAALAQLASGAGLYPDPECLAVRAAIARYHGVTPDMVAVANGTDELILLTCLTFAAPGAEQADVIVTDRTFPGYRSSAAVARATVRTVPMPGEQIPVGGLCQAMREAPGLAFVCSPHNPTGAMLDSAGVAELAGAAHASGSVLVLDEAYLDFADPIRDVALGAVAAGGRLIVLRTFSKAWGLASLRIGYAIGPAELIGPIWRTRSCLPFDVNRLAQHAAVAALDSPEHIGEVRAMTAQAREALCKELDAIGVKFAPSACNFVMLKLDRDSTEVASALASAHRVLVRDLAPFGLPGCLRVTVGTTDQVSRFCAALADVLGHPGGSASQAGAPAMAAVAAEPEADGWAAGSAAPALATATTLFNGYIGAHVFYALHELGVLRRLEQGTASVRGLAAADSGRLAALLRTFAQLGFVELAGDAVTLTARGSDLMRYRGPFIWGVGGHGPVWAGLAAMTEGRASFGREVRRNEALVAMGAGEAGRLLMQPIQDRVSAMIDFESVVDIGCGDGSRLLRMCGGERPRRGVGIDISHDACKLAADKVAAHGLADRIEIVQADILALMGTRSFPGVDLVMSIFMLHDLFAAVPDHAAMMRSLRGMFPDARYFLLADTALRTDHDEPMAPIFSLGFELAHAFMGVTLQPRQTYEAAFEAAGLRLLRRAPFGLPATWIFLLEAT
jgi:histidinol-phosphate aminotransferase